MKYNDNINLDLARIGEKLNPNQYYALMVTDHNDHRPKRPASHFFVAETGWVCLECTQDQRIYISKDIKQRRDIIRGVVMIITVKDISKCCIL